MALDYVSKMKLQNIEPDEVTFILLCSGCANTPSLKICNELDNMISAKYGSNRSPELSNTLINMHCKCSSIIKAEVLFRETSRCDNIYNYDQWIWVEWKKC